MAIQNAAWLQIEGKDTRIRMPSMTVRKSFKLFPGNGIRVVVMPRRLWHVGCIYIVVRWAQAHLDSFAGKEQTVGNRGAQNHRSSKGDGWVAEAKQFSAANSNTEIQRWVHGWREPTVL